MGRLIEGGKANAGKQPEEFSRRELFRRAKNHAIKTAVTVGVAGATVATIDSVALFENFLTFESSPLDTPLDSENYKMKRSNTMLRVVMSEHHEEDWNRHHAEIEKEIDSASIVIPEYYPREYAHLEGTLNPLYVAIGGYKKGNGLFNHIEDLCAKKGKSIWVVDPEYNEQGANLRYELFSPAFLAQLGFVVGLLSNSDKVIHQKISRRSWEKRILTILGISTVAAIGNVPFAFSVENNLRHVISAELLDQLDKSGKFSSGTNPDEQEKITMFIPQSHWKGIRSYLEDPEGRKKRLDLYKQLFGSQFPGLFEARHYEGAAQPSDQPIQPLETLSLLK